MLMNSSVGLQDLHALTCRLMRQARTGLRTISKAMEKNTFTITLPWFAYQSTKDLSCTPH